MISSSRYETINSGRRLFIGTTVAIAAAAELGVAPIALAQSQEASFGRVRQVNAGVLSIGYVEAGSQDAPVVILLHGWPYDIHSYADVTRILKARGFRVIVPFLRGYGSTRLLDDAAPRNGQQAALAADVLALMDALRIPSAIIGGYDWGARTANIVAALHPERCAGMISVSGYLIGSQAANQRPLPPSAELAWWYQYYFATERGRAGYAANTNDFARLIWRTASPRWNFDEATFARSAEAFANPDHVAIVIHNYRWRLGLADGEARYDASEKLLATAPPISVPTITLEGDANGAPHPRPEDYDAKFTGRYEHRTISGSVGHNLPQEAPAAFAQAIIDISRG